jgi:hypothetical protein
MSRITLLELQLRKVGTQVTEARRLARSATSHEAVAAAVEAIAVALDELVTGLRDIDPNKREP